MVYDTLGYDTLGYDTLIAHYGNEQVGDAGCAHVAKRSQLLTANLIQCHQIEQQNAATDRLAFVHRLECPCHRDLLGMHCHFQIARLQLFHAALEYDAAAVDEHEIGEDVLDLFHLMRRHYDGAVTIKVVVQQRIVELLAVQDVQTQRRLVQHQQSRVNRHDQSEVQLSHHPLGQFPHPATAPDGGLR